MKVLEEISRLRQCAFHTLLIFTCRVAATLQNKDARIRARLIFSLHQGLM